MEPPSKREAFHDPQTFEIIGAAMAVHAEFGSGFQEPVYREGFTIELRRRRIPFMREVVIPMRYKGEVLPVHYRADFMCYEEVLVELKALPAVGRVEYGQVLITFAQRTSSAHSSSTSVRQASSTEGLCWT